MILMKGFEMKDPVPEKTDTGVTLSAAIRLWHIRIKALKGPEVMRILQNNITMKKIVLGEAARATNSNHPRPWSKHFMQLREFNNTTGPRPGWHLPHNNPVRFSQPHINLFKSETFCGTSVQN